VARGGADTRALACLWDARAAVSVADHDRVVVADAAVDGATGTLALPVGASRVAATAGCDPAVLATAPRGAATTDAQYRSLLARYDTLITARTSALDAAVGRAAPSAALPWAVAGGMVILLALVGRAFWPRVREYRS
jgi:hypothetical protein